MHYRSISPDVLDIRAASKRDQGETNARYRITLQHDIWSKAREITNKSRRDRGEIKSHYNLISGPKQERPRTKRGEIKERPNRITSSYVAQSKRQAAQRGKRERGNREMQQRERQRREALASGTRAQTIYICIPEAANRRVKCNSTWTDQSRNSWCLTRSLCAPVG